MNYIENIKRIRIDKRLSQTDMAEKLGIAQNNYGRIERGLTELSVDRVYKIAEILEVSVLNILGEVGNSPESPEIERLRKEHENLKEVLSSLNHRVKDFEVRASMYSRIEDYYLQSLQDDLDELCEDFFKEEYEKWINPIENQEDKLNSHYFLIFSERQNWYEMAIDELSILRDSKLVFAWKRYNYINALHLTAGDYQDILGDKYYERMSSEESMYKVVDIRAKSEKYKYRDFEINIVKEKIRKFFEKLNK
jgi:transcriptional regulator with XRE-family HTH domain